MDRERLMKKKLLIIVLGFLFSPLSQADNKTYYPPQVVKNCHRESGIARCDFDNTFLRVHVPPKDLISGDYTFDNASAFSSHPTGHKGYTILYTYQNTQRKKIYIEGAYIDSLAPDLIASSSQWMAKGDNFYCQGAVLRCPFTRTPWSQNIPSTSTNSFYHHPFISELPINIPHFPVKYDRTNHTSIKNNTMQYTLLNNTDYPVVVRKSDNNEVAFELTRERIPPHTTMLIIKDLLREPTKILMLDITMTDSERNTDNTCEFSAHGWGYLFSNYIYFINHELFAVESDPFSKLNEVKLIIDRKKLK